MGGRGVTWIFITPPCLYCCLLYLQLCSSHVHLAYVLVLQLCPIGVAVPVWYTFHVATHVKCAEKCSMPPAVIDCVDVVVEKCNMFRAASPPYSAPGLAAPKRQPIPWKRLLPRSALDSALQQSITAQHATTTPLASRPCFLIRKQWTDKSLLCTSTYPHC